MAMRYGFFNSKDSDRRKYDAMDFARRFSLYFTNGVYKSDGAAMEVAPGTGLNVAVGAGAAHVKGYYGDTTGETLSLLPAIGANRTDRVVVRLDLDPDARTVTLAVKQGGASPPSLTRTATLYELSLARVTVRNGSSVILPTDIVDERGDAGLCGWVTSVGEPAYYPLSDIPEMLWRYTLYPETMDATAKATVENNPSLMAMWTDSRVWKTLRRDQKEVWFVTDLGTTNITVPYDAKLKIYAIGQGAAGGTEAIPDGGKGGGCAIDIREYKRGDVIACSLSTNANTSVLCAPRGLNMYAAAGSGRTAGGTASGGNVANYTGGNGGEKGYIYLSDKPMGTNAQDGQDSLGCGGGGGARDTVNIETGISANNKRAGNGGTGGISCGNGGNLVRGGSLSYGSTTGGIPGNGGSNPAALFGGNGGSPQYSVGGVGGDSSFIGGHGRDGYSGAYGSYGGGNGGNAIPLDTSVPPKTAFGWYSFGGTGGRSDSYGDGKQQGFGGNGTVGGPGGSTGGTGYRQSGLGSLHHRNYQGMPSIGAFYKFPPITNYGGGNGGAPIVIIEEV